MTERGPAAADTAGLVIAIDGPSGTGKSTVARAVARALGLRYLDTGAMYRAVTWLALDRKADLSDPTALTALARSAVLSVSTDPEQEAVSVDGVDVTAAIRSTPVTEAVSAVSAVADLRIELVRRQQAIISRASSHATGAGGIVVEGRDIGTTVAPHAPVKVFLTAAAGARAQRRGSELAGDGLDAATLAATEQALRRRDAADSSRAASPFTKAADAVVIDTTDLTVADVVERVLDRVAAVVHS